MGRIIRMKTESGGRLSTSNRILTANSGTTIYIDYSYELNTLEAKFRNSNKIYQYTSVNPELWEEFKAEVESGGSSGNFINTRIKPFFEVKEIT